jgi:uncharacterized phage protein (TIGR01671 family)
MREIKFRAWFAKKMWYSITQIVFNKLGICTAYLNNDDDDFNIPADTWTGKDDYQIMQYTGLKDKNGKEVYEGDIVALEIVNEDSCMGATFEETYTVEWDERRKLTQLNDGKHYVLGEYTGTHRPMLTYITDSSQQMEVEVIGNIYENPELLEDAIRADVESRR